MTTPLVGHLDPAFLEVMDEIQDLLRYVFRTDNRLTLAVSGTGSAAMEAAIGNLVEPGESVLLRTKGYWGARMAEMARRAGGEVVSLDTPANEPIDPADVAAAFDRHSPTVFGICHADTTTGIRQPAVDELARIARENDAYTILDCVTSLGGIEVQVDDWGVDVAYSAAQKSLSAPPGASPLTMSERAVDKLLARETPPRSWYLDLSLLAEYWGEERAYHHTAPITAMYALREALRIAAEEGIEARWERHRRVAGELRDGVREMGLEMNAPDEYWLPTLNAVRVPDGVDADAVIDRLREDHGVEVAGGLGPLAGDIWRIGCMGYSARRETVAYLLAALADALRAEGYRPAASAI